VQEGAHVSTSLSNNSIALCTKKQALFSVSFSPWWEVIHGTFSLAERLFSTANSLGGCALAGTDNFYGIVRSGTTDFTCSSMQQKPDGLHLLSCGEFGDQLIPFSAIVV
jgi:hypothetical protein